MIKDQNLRIGFPDIPRVKQLHWQLGHLAFAVDFDLQLETDFGVRHQRSIVGFDRSFDDLWFLIQKFRQVLFYVVRGQVHRLIRAGF